MSGVVEPMAAAVTLAATLLLGAAGVFKLSRPDETTVAITVLGLPPSVTLVRLMAIGELATAGAVLVTGAAPFLLLLSGWYLAFAVFVMVAMAGDVPLRSCGCFGKPDTPPSGVHVVVDALAAAAALVCAASSLDPVAAVGDHAVVGLAGVGVLAYLMYGMMTALPMAMRAAKGAR